ncbi:MAG: hypothetical protein JO352_10920 [Chloroflexi bacterium]|nr:hypothetical protein [Chloroflexota bacterium]
MLKSVFAGRWMAGVVLVLAIWLAAQVGAVLAAPDSMAASVEVAQGTLPTPTPFRFLTPTPFVPGATTTTRPATAPNAGGFPMELAFPILAGGLVAIGGGSLVLRRKTTP